MSIVTNSDHFPIFGVICDQTNLNGQRDLLARKLVKDDQVLPSTEHHPDYLYNQQDPGPALEIWVTLGFGQISPAPTPDCQAGNRRIRFIDEIFSCRARSKPVVTQLRSQHLALR